MKVPIISKDQASVAWNSMNNEGEYDASKVVYDYVDSDGGLEVFSDVELDWLWRALSKIMESFGEEKPIGVGGHIDSLVIEPVYTTLQEYGITPYQLSHIGFWQWFSNIAYSGRFWKFIKWRFGSSKQINWGICNPSLMIEVYFYRAWLRGHKMYDKDLPDPFHYARLGGSDIWRSHVLRQDFGRDKEFVKALLDTIYDKNGNVIIGTQELRKSLIPAIRAWTSGSTFSHLTYQENLELIEWLRSEDF